MRRRRWRAPPTAARRNRSPRSRRTPSPTPSPCTSSPPARSPPAPNAPASCISRSTTISAPASCSRTRRRGRRRGCGSSSEVKRSTQFKGDDMALENKVALVTGGGRGIGRGIALALARAGADVAIAEVDRVASSAQQYRDAALSGYRAAEQTVAEVCGLGRRAVAIRADVTRAAEVSALIDTTVAQLGGVDVLVCNAGVVHVSPVEKLSEEAFDLTMAVNVRACSCAV